MERMDKNKILKESFGKAEEYIEHNNCKETPVVNYLVPEDLSRKIDFSIGEAGVSQEDFLGLIDSYLAYSVRTGNKQFLNQLYAGINFPSFIGELFTVLTNTSMYTYEVAPVATLIENEMIKLINSYFGFHNGDGVFLSGGSNANLLAMFSARNMKHPESRFDGYDRTSKLKAFVSDQAHYSFDTAANLLGLGSKNVIKVKTDRNGRMIPAELKKAIEQSEERGEKPFFVAATCATTVMGAYDPIEEIAEVCRGKKIWLHADGSFGGSIILSDKHRHLMKGVELCDSIAWDSHKLMNIPLICSALLVKDKNRLPDNLTDINTDYIFHDIDETDDLGKKSVQCGRRVDAVKLWFAWKYYGRDGYRDRMDNLITMAEYAENKVMETESLELLAPRQSFTICFRYRPSFKTDLNQFNLNLREKLRKGGSSIVNYGFMGETLALRLVVANGEIYKEDIDLFFENLLEAGRILESNGING